MYIKLLVLNFFLLPALLTAQAEILPAYGLFDSEGNKVSWNAMTEELGKADVVLFGELHSDPIAHWLQLQMTKAMHGKFGENLLLGAEMLESDGQLILSEFLAGSISEKNYLKEMRLWPNYPTDYHPLVVFAKEHGIPFVATNVPRRYANLVYREGLEGLDNLSKQAKGYLAPLPIDVDLELNCYKSMMGMMEGHGGENFPKAQALKDATMAHFIARHWKSGKFFLHFNGAYHSDNHESIEWYLNKYIPKAQVATISTVHQKDIGALSDENKGKANYILVVPEDMTQTY